MSLDFNVCKFFGLNVKPLLCARVEHAFVPRFAPPAPVFLISITWGSGWFSLSRGPGLRKACGYRSRGSYKPIRDD
jgi:hypothetical protein